MFSANANLRKPKGIGASVVALAVSLLSALPSHAQDKVTEIKVALSWLRNGQYAALLLADANGYLASAGIHLTIINGGPGKNPVPLVAAGQSDFGITRGPDIFLAQVAPDPVDIVALGAIVQKDPGVFLTLADPNAPAPVPKDMEGKTVGIQAGTDFTLKAMAAKSGADFSKIRLTTVGAGAEPLLVGQVDFFSAILTNQVYQVEQEIAKPDAPPRLKGKKVMAVGTYEFGVPIYNDVIFTSRATLKAHPDLVKAFVGAMARGTQFMVEHPEEAAAIVAKYPEQIEDIDKLRWRFGVQDKISVSNDTVDYGYLWMDAALWRASMDLYKESGLVDRTVAPEQFMTNEFNPGIHSHR